MDRHDHDRDAYRAMWAFADWLKSRGEGFDDWPDNVKAAFSEAVIDHGPLTDADIAATERVLACIRRGFVEPPG